MAWDLIAIVSQAIILASIFGVTGIPPTEKQAIAATTRIVDCLHCRRNGVSNRGFQRKNRDAAVMEEAHIPDTRHWLRARGN